VTRAALAALLLAVAAPAAAGAGRYAVGVAPGASVAEVAARVEAATGTRVSRELAPLRAVVVEAESARELARLRGVEYVERVDRRRRLAFAPNDPLVAKQWYLQQIRAFDAWPELPSLAAVRVAIIDSGIDADHPEFEGRIAATRSFVGGSAKTDNQGHGTFVAGLIAANTNNEEGIAGLAFPAQLVVAKVVRPDRSISLEAEARAIRWAVDQGARVINLSLGGVRDPLNPSRDTFSPLEAAAISYAYSRGVVLVAAVGNADQAPSRPWPFASYPAALPHVIGVSALGRDGSVPTFSDRDQIYNDLAAPGQGILSTFPRALTALRTGCVNQGYSDCGPDEYRQAEGTSFAAPLVSAAAALVLAVRAELTPDQVTTLITRTAVDVNASTGCRQCPLQRDALSGWGRLDVAAAVVQTIEGTLPAQDRFEANDDAGPAAFRLWGRERVVEATIDFWDDQSDVYAIRLRGDERLVATLKGPGAARLFLWRPGTTRVEGLSVGLQRKRVAQSLPVGAGQRFAYRAPVRGGGWYFLQVKIGSQGSGAYTLTYRKTSRAAPKLKQASTKS
jgi:hypothetical protein